MVRLNSIVLCGFRNTARFFKRTTQNARLNTKAEPAIILNAASRTSSDWLSAFSVNTHDRLVFGSGNDKWGHVLVLLSRCQNAFHEDCYLVIYQIIFMIG